MKNRFTLSILTGLGLVMAAHAQSYSSFGATTSLTGVTVTPLSNLNYDVTLKSGATFTSGGTKFDITQIFGFYELSSTGALGSPTGSNFSGWKFADKKDKSGEVAGWSHDSASGRMNPGDTLEFKYSKLTPSSNYGFHFSYTPVGGGNTTTGFFAGPPPVPEPSTFFALGGGMLGLLGLGRRRARA